MASGDTLCVFTPQSGIPPASGYPTIDTRNSVLVLDFDADADEAMVFQGVMPRHYAGGGVTITVHGMFTSATSGTCRFETAFERQNTDQDSDSFATANSGSITANGTSGIPSSGTTTHTNGAQMDSVAAGEIFRLKFNRDADGSTGTDSATGDFELLAIEIRET